MTDYTPKRKPSTSPGTHVSFQDSSYIKTPIYTHSTSNQNVVYKEVIDNRPISRNYYKETGGTNNGW